MTIHAPGDILEKPHYLGEGILDTVRDRIFAARAQGRGENWSGAVDIFSISTRKILRTIPIPVVATAMALSPSGKYLAVSTSQGKGVRIYDLELPWSRPALLLEIDTFEGSLLGFASDKVLLTGSSNVAEIYRFTLPL